MSERAQARDYLAESEVIKGQTVIYVGPDNSEEIYEAWSRPQVLKSGHPGRIYDPTIQHIRVEWVGLEHEPISYAVGFSTNRSEVGPEGKAYIRGLAKISAEEYAELAASIERGTPPQDVE